MNFQMIGPSITNLDAIETVSAYDNKKKIDYDMDEDTGVEKEIVRGEPYEIHFDMKSGKVIKLRYKDSMSRDHHFTSLQRTLTELK